MKISIEQEELILQQFPKIELSYEEIIYKKVSNVSFAITIPDGKKCFAWFTRYTNKNVCFILELLDNKINSIELINSNFSSELSNGTVIYGTLFLFNNKNVFNIEDIFYYKGENIKSLTFYKKLEIFNTLFSKKEIHQECNDNSYIIFGLPVIASSFFDIIKKN